MYKKLFAVNNIGMGREVNLKNYANSLYQNARIGIQTINNLLSYVKDKGLKEELKNELDEYNGFNVRLEKFARANDIELKDNGFFEKLRLWGSTKMAALMGKSVRDYVQSLLVGTVMGLSKLYKDKWDYQHLSQELDALRDELEAIEEHNYKALRELLKTNL